MGFFSKLFDPSAGEIKRLNKIVDKIDSFEEEHKALTDEQIQDAMADNPSGQGDELTPFILIHPLKD